MKAARTFRGAQLAMIDHAGFQEALNRMKTAEKNAGLRCRPRSRWLFVVSLYNLALLGSIKSQKDADAWLVQVYQDGNAVAPKAAA